MTQAPEKVVKRIATTKTISRDPREHGNFEMKTTEETIAQLNRPIDPRHIQQREIKGKALEFVPWAIICRHLHHRAPGWCWELQEVKLIANVVSVTGRLTIPTSDGVIHYSAVATEPLEGPSKAPPVETAASSALRRAAALAGLGLDLWIQ